MIQCCIRTSSLSLTSPLRKHAYSNILKILQLKKENFQIKNSDNVHISARNIDCGYSLEPPRRGGSNEYPQSMFLGKNKKHNVYPCKPQFCWPRWLSWMRRPTGDQEVAGSTPAEVGNILSWRLIMKYFLRSFFPFR